MFARVAHRYDRANHLLSIGVDVLWRRAAVRLCQVRAGERALDVCSGTGDLSFALARAGAAVVGADFCAEMLALARRKGGRVAGPVRPEFVVADALRLPFAAGTFDVATIAFGIRNVSDPVGGLREMMRVCRPGGRIVVLEFCRPRVPVLRSAYLLYFRKVLPRLGRIITGDRNGSYDYLRDSVMRFPERDEFLRLMGDAGLESPRARVLTGGIASLYRAEIPGR